MDPRDYTVRVGEPDPGCENCSGSGWLETDESDGPCPCTAEMTSELIQVPVRACGRGDSVRLHVEHIPDPDAQLRALETALGFARAAKEAQQIPLAAEAA